jgi:hypothetical protein
LGKSLAGTGLVVSRRFEFLVSETQAFFLKSPITVHLDVR